MRRNTKMRRYTNKRDEVVEVSQEHLETAVEIKLQLQEMSPSRRVVWSKHRELMKQEGFENSDVNEAYRCLVKDYQKKIGKLVPVKKHADMVSTSKLESIRNMVGEMYQEKRENQIVLRDLNKAKRDLADFHTIAEEVRDAMLDNCVIEVPEYAYKGKLERRENELVVCLQDWHVGAVVEGVYGNDYNFEIAKKRLEKMKEEVLYYVKTFNVNDVTVIHNGDIIEQISMRPTNQPFECEFNMAEQINKATRLVIDFVVSLTAYCNVELGLTSGNHDRMQSHKDSVITGDNVTAVIYESIKTFVEMANIPRLSLIDNTEYNYSILKKFGKDTYIKFVHGDKEKQADANKIASHESMDNVELTALVMGHFHSHKVIDRNFSKKEIYFGSLMGRNDYARNFKGMSDASQGVIVVRGDGKIIPIEVNLQIN